MERAAKNPRVDDAAALASGFDFDICCCPATLASTGEVVDLSIEDGVLASTTHTYPMIDGVPDFRLTVDRDGTSYDEILPEWSSFANDPAMLQSISNAMEIDERDVEGKTVLVAGVGAGTELNIILRMAPARVYAIDFSSFVVKQSKLRDYQGVTFMIGDLCNLPFKPDTFDYVISGGIIHHTRSPELAHRNIWRVTKPGGYINYGHVYLDGPHNRRVTLDRERFGFHRMNPKRAKRILSVYAYVYKALLVSRIHMCINRRRWRAPFLLEGNHAIDASVRHHRNGLFDYYLCRYRHVIPKDDVVDWFQKLGGTVRLVPKGFVGRKSAPR